MARKIEYFLALSVGWEEPSVVIHFGNGMSDRAFLFGGLMKIIEEGNPNWENNTKIFDCQRCECVFEANDNEYIFADYLMYAKGGIEAFCKCPKCGGVAFSYR